MNYDEHVLCWKCMCATSVECWFILHLCMLVSFNSSIDFFWLCSWGCLPICLVFVGSSSPVWGMGTWQCQFPFFTNSQSTLYIFIFIQVKKFIPIVIIEKKCQRKYCLGWNKHEFGKNLEEFINNAQHFYGIVENPI